MYYVAKQLWCEAVPRQAAAAGRRGRPPRRRSSRARRTRQGPRQAGDARRRTRRRPWTKIKTFIREKKILHAAGPGPLQDHRDAGVPARLLGGVPEPGPAARPEGGQPVRRQPAAAATGRRRGGQRSCSEYNRSMLQILTIHEAYPGHYVQLEYSQPPPVADPQGAVLRRLRRGLGRLHRADDARPGLRRRRPAAAAAPAQVLPAGRAQRDPRPQDALHEHDRRGGDEAARRPRLPDRRRGRRQDRTGEAELAASSRPTSSAGRRSTACGRRCSASRATSSTWASSTRRC